MRCHRTIAQQALLPSTPSLVEQNGTISTALHGVDGGRESSRRGEMRRHARGHATSLSVAERQHVQRDDDDDDDDVHAAADVAFHPLCNVLVATS